MIESVTEHVVRAVDLQDFVPDIEVARVVVASRDQFGVSGGAPLGGLHDQASVGYLSDAAGMIEVEVAEDDVADVFG